MIIQGTETLTSLIHIISESLLTPVVILLVISIVIVILSFGGLINEYISRKPIKSNDLEDLIRRVSFSTNVNQMKDEIANSDLFDYQKEILTRIADNYDIGPEARKALASELISAHETRLIKKTNKTDILVRVGPILGLLGTLIPLGPGLAALGSGDIATLAESLTIAFDTTVTGLTVGGISFLISKYKKQWYESDLIDVESVAEAVLTPFFSGKGKKQRKNEYIILHIFSNLVFEYIQEKHEIFNLPIENSHREILLIKKNSKTNKIFPRTNAQIKKNPLLYRINVI